MIPGLWGAPLKPLSGILPPLSTQEYILGASSSSSPEPSEGLPPNRKLANILKEPPGFQGFFDYAEGLAYARKVKKPIFLDFTGHSCVNCRKMEETVWVNPQVKEKINRDYVLISLYVDEKIELPLKEQYYSKILESKVKTVGDLNSDIEATKFNTNSQPYYVLLDNDENKLMPPRAFDQNIEAFQNFLQKGSDLFHQKTK
jgi:thiol:disulfide interchange protein DsbD